MADAFSGKSAVVTGGSRGIGYAIADALITRGVHVLITGTDTGTLERARAQLSASAPAAVRIEAIAADVRDAAQVEAALSRAADRFGGVDILVNNAGVGVFRRVAEMTPEEWSRVIDTNLTGVFNGCRAAIPHLRRRGGGWIINISSLASKNPFAGGAAYSASKSALNAFSEALMQEVRYDGIRVSYVLPGSVQTTFGGHEEDGADWKLSPADIAEVVVDLVAHPARSLPSRVELRPARPPKK